MEKKKKVPKPVRVSKDKKEKKDAKKGDPSKPFFIFGTIRKKGKALPFNNLEAVAPVLDKLLDQIQARGDYNIITLPSIFVTLDYSTIIYWLNDFCAIISALLSIGRCDSPSSINLLFKGSN